MERNDLVAEAGRHVDLVQSEKHTKSACVAQPLHQRQDRDLVSHVERRYRLVQQQASGVLGDKHRQPDPLALTT